MTTPLENIENMENTENTENMEAGSRSKRRWPVFVAAGFIALIVFGGIGFVTASALEERDTFCISCHTVPETTYYNRAYLSLDNPTTPITDLATQHYHQSQAEGKTPFTCIDCHRGDASLGNRISTLALGGRDALIYVAGKENPAIEKGQISERWLPNASCITCHTTTLLTLKGLDNHYHTHLPEAAAALAAGGTLTVPDALASKREPLLNVGLKTINTPLMCSDCHQTHVSVAGGPLAHFMDIDRRNAACVSCHQIAKEGPQDAKNLQ